MNAKIEAREPPAEYDLQEFDSQDKHVSQSRVTALHRGKDKLVLDLKAVADDAQALLKEVVNSSAETMAGVPTYLEQRFGTVKSNLQRAKGAMDAKAKQAAAATDQYVRGNPWKVMGFATAASVVVSFFLVRAWVRNAGKSLEGDK